MVINNYIWALKPESTFCESINSVFSCNKWWCVAHRSLLTGLFAPSSGTIEVYGRDMQTNIDDVRKELGVCMQYDVLFDHMTTKEHLLLYGQIKAPHWSRRELLEQVRTWVANHLVQGACLVSWCTQSYCIMSYRWCKMMLRVLQCQLY